METTYERNALGGPTSLSVEHKAEADSALIAMIHLILAVRHGLVVFDASKPKHVSLVTDFLG